MNYLKIFIQFSNKVTWNVSEISFKYKFSTDLLLFFHRSVGKHYRILQTRVDDGSRQQSKILPKSQLFLEAEADAGRYPKIFLSPQNVLASAFQLATAARVFFWRQNVLVATANREAEATGGRRQYIVLKQDDLEAASSGFCFPTGGVRKTGGEIFASSRRRNEYKERNFHYKKNNFNVCF